MYGGVVSVFDEKVVVKRSITRSAIEFCGLWKQLKSLNFKSIEFDAFKNESGSNSFALTGIISTQTHYFFQRIKYPFM